MDNTALEDLFAPLGRVSIRRMFGGKGIYRLGVMFALEAGGVVYLKSLPEHVPLFEAAGSAPFGFERRTPKGTARTMITSYWSLPHAALDDLDALKAWAARALAAAESLHKKKPGRGPASKSLI